MDVEEGAALVSYSAVCTVHIVVWDVDLSILDIGFQASLCNRDEGNEL